MGAVSSCFIGSESFAGVEYDISNSFGAFGWGGGGEWVGQWKTMWRRYTDTLSRRFTWQTTTWQIWQEYIINHNKKYISVNCSGLNPGMTSSGLPWGGGGGGMDLVSGFFYKIPENSENNYESILLSHIQ